MDGKLLAFPLLAAWAWSAAGPALAADAPARLTLEQAVDRALAESPAAAQATESVREAEAGLSAAKLATLPRLTAKTAATRGDDPVYAFGSLLEQRRFGPQNFAIDALNHPGYLTNVKSSLELGVPLFTGFALSDGRKLGRLQAAAAGAGEAAALQSVRLQTTEAYLRLLLGRSVVANADARIAAAAGEIEDARRLRARGLVLGSDFYAAQALLEGLQAARARAAHERDAAQATLAILLSEQGPIEPAGSLEDPNYSTATLDALTAQALRDRQDLRQASAGQEAAAVLARREALSALPTVEAFAALETDTSDFGSNPSNRLVGVRAALPLGDPTYFARRRRGNAGARAARAGTASLEQAARVDVAQRYEEYAAASEMIPILKDSVEKAEKSLELFRPLYREGRQSIFDVLRAEEALMQARSGYFEALYRAHDGYARLRRAAGGLDASAVREIDGRLGGRR